MGTQEIYVRRAESKDVPFVLDSWIRSCSDYPRDSKREWILRELARPGSEVMVATLDEDHDLLLGWAATRADPVRGDVVLYVYVKLAYRGNGIAKALLEGKPFKRAQALPRHRGLPEGIVYDRWA